MRETTPRVGESVRSLQTFLRRIAQQDAKIPMVIPDGIYDEQTQNAVFEFQGVYGLSQTGETDFETWKKIVEIYDSIPTNIHMPDIRCLFPFSNYRIMPNQTADCLYLIQAMITVIGLHHEGVNAPEISGTHTPDSVEAVIAIQEIAGLEPTGVIDVETYNNIVKLYNSIDN